MTLNSVTQAFNMVSSTLPVGLTLGSNYFYTPMTGGSCCTGVTGQFNSSTNGTGQTVTRWQGVTFSGLTAGTYSYSITGMNSVNWADWNSNTSNWTGLLDIPGSSVSVPEPATLALLGFGFAGLGFSRRRKQKEVA